MDLALDPASPNPLKGWFSPTIGGVIAWMGDVLVLCAGRGADNAEVQLRLVRLEDEKGGVVCEQCLVADTVRTRMKGLLGRRSLEPGEGLLIRPAGSIHTFFMAFSIDAVFLDRDLRVVGVAGDLRPWRVAARRGARAVLELAAGEAARRDVAAGQRLVLAEEQGDQAAQR